MPRDESQTREDMLMHDDHASHISVEARVRRVGARAIETLGASKAAHWMSTPCRALGGAVPRHLAAESEVGAREVERILGRIDHGVHS